MDDTTFQRELCQLKHRVAQMASSFERLPSTATQPTIEDAFAHQLDDVKTRLQSMQSSLGHLITERSQQPRQTLPQAVEPAGPLAENMSALGSNRFALPSGPLFWQLFTSLRTDVRGLNNRVAALELNYADLEDRVEDLEPNKHTPPASENDDLSFQQRVEGFPATTAPDTYCPQPTANAAHDQFLGFNFDGEADSSASTNASMFVPPGANATASEGVAFRDREIAQLEDLIRQTQDDLRRNEELVIQKDAQLDQINTERQSRDSINYARIAELDGISSERGKLANAYHEEIRQLQASLQTKDATLQTRTAQQYALQQAFLRKKTQLSQAGRHVQELERNVYELQNSRKDAIDGVTATKDEEIRKLRDFCEAKETLVSQQEQIIKRGAGIIEERDEEIERLSRQLKILNDDHRQEEREQERCSRLLEERDDEIKQLRASLTKALMPASAHQAKPERRSMYAAADAAQPRDGESLIQCSPFATTGESSSGKTFMTQQWTPQAIDKYVKMPHEQERVSAWGQNVPSRYKFGVPGVATPPTQQQSSRAAEGQRRDLRRSDSLKLLRRLALVEEGANLPAQNMTERSERTHRQRLPLDDICRPPLPAPLPPRPWKTASFADLGSAARRDGEFGPDAQRPLFKHQSIQDLPRSKMHMQPYVEEAREGGPGGHE